MLINLANKLIIRQYLSAFLAFFVKVLFCFLILFPLPVVFAENLTEEGKTSNENEAAGTIESKEELNLLNLPVDVYNYLIERPEEMIKFLKRREYYKQKEKELQKDITTTQDEADISAIKESTTDDIKNILVFVSEIPADGENVIYAPIFIADRKNIFGTITDFSFKWVGYKTSFNFKQDKFPWNSAALTETVVGSFLYASGTNTGFNRGKQSEENRFYTNYISEIISLKQKLPLFTYIAFTLDSRQYFFVKHNTPPNYIMPKNHYNIFPRLDLSLDYLKEKGIDQLASGLKILGWVGYGVRNRWEEWGEPGNLQMGDKARKFWIYSGEATAGLLFKGNHNIVIRGRYKGGVNNDFLTMPRFGGTIDNAKLDVVHGTTLDQFRVKEFGLLNSQYGFNLFKRLRINLFLDYARIFSPEERGIFGSGYGFRVLAWGGLPIWLTHGICREYSPEKKPVENVFMIMTAAGW